MRFKKFKTFKSEIVKLTLRFIPKNITRNVYHIQFINSENFKAKLR